MTASSIEITAGIVAHDSRRTRAGLLYEELNDYFPTGLFLDDGSLGMDYNHLRTWEAIASNAKTPWCMVVEDDACPIKDLGYHLGQALFYAPSPVVNLYLGRARPAHWQLRIERAVAHTDRPFILGTHMLNTVAIVMRTELVMGMLMRAREAINSEVHKPIDEAITEWLRAESRPVAYTSPSLVDHADISPVATHSYLGPVTEPRVAWRVGVPDLWVGPLSLL